VTPIIATPPEDITFVAGQPPDVIENDAAKPTSGVATPIAATTPKDASFSTDEPQDAIGHDVGKLKPSVATPTQENI
jgi:hypothetical protein